MLDLVGSKSMGGALNLEPGLQEKDFEELARERVWIVREIDLGEVGRPEEANFTVK
jgi:enamidase